MKKVSLKKFLTWGWKKDKKDEIFSTDEIRNKKIYFLKIKKY